MSIDSKKRESIFHEAAQIDSAEEQLEFLQSACGSDVQLLSELRELLEHDRKQQGLLDSPFVGPITEGWKELPLCEPPGTIVGAYELVEPIGQGAFGVVYLADQQRPLRRQVALKIIKPGMDSQEVIARFEAERQALALMDHPNICRVYDAGATESGRPYFVMELVRGVAITDYAAEHGLNLRARLELFLTACNAMQHAHAVGVVHRDLKPSNVLVAHQDNSPVLKVIDFGIAKSLAQKLSEKTLQTASTQVIGTPLYMSPEQAALNGSDVDYRSDVYSLGVMLYELLTGTTPFGRERFSTASYAEMCHIIQDEDPPRPSKRLSTLVSQGTETPQQYGVCNPQSSAAVRGDLDWIVMKAMEKDPSRRYQSVECLKQDLERHLRDEPVSARPPSLLYRSRKLMRRHRTSVAAALLTILALVLGVAVGGSLIPNSASDTDPIPTAAMAGFVPEDHDKIWELPTIYLPGAIADHKYSVQVKDYANRFEYASPIRFRKVAGPEWLSVEDEGFLVGTPSTRDIGVNDFMFWAAIGARKARTKVRVFVVGSNALVCHLRFQGNEVDEYSRLPAFSHGNPMYVPGIESEAIRLDGTDDYLQLSENVSLLNAFTVAAWVKWHGGDAWQRIFDFGNNTDQFVYVTPKTHEETLRFAIKNGGFEQSLTAQSAPTDVWFHVAVTLDSGVGILYLNGTETDRGKISIRPIEFRPRYNYLGRSQYLVDPNLNGCIDDFRVYCRALTPQEIQQLASLGPGDLQESISQIRPN